MSATNITDVTELVKGPPGVKPTEEYAMQKLSKMAEELDASGKLDATTGKITAKPEVVDSIINKYLSPQISKSVSNSLKNHINLGFAMTKGPNIEGAVPWSLFQERGASKEIIAAMGISPDDDPKNIVKHIHSKFPNAPSFIKEDQIKQLQTPKQIPKETDNPKEFSHKVVVKEPTVPVAITLSQAFDGIKCLLNKGACKFSAKWWGYVFWVESTCALHLADLSDILALDLRAKALKDLNDLINKGHIENLMTIVPILIEVVTSIYYAALARAIRGFVHHGSNGVNINGTWVPPGVMWISKP